MSPLVRDTFLLVYWCGASHHVSFLFICPATTTCLAHKSITEEIQIAECKKMKIEIKKKRKKKKVKLLKKLVSEI